MSDKFFVGLDVTGFENNGKKLPVSRVTLLVDDENVLTAGDDTGYELTASCPHATQAMVDSALAMAGGHQYQMYDAVDANIDPAAELGDGLDVGGIYSIISRIGDDGSGYAGLSAPGEEELTDDFPSSGPVTQEFERKIAVTRSLITKTAEQIRFEVENELEGLSSAIEIDLTEIIGRVEDAETGVSTIRQTVSSIETTVQGLEGDLSTIEQTVDSITLSVSNGESSSTIKLLVDGVAVTSKKIQFNGMVTFSDLDGSSGTIIDGGAIDTETLCLDTLYGDEIYLMDGDGYPAAKFMVTGADSYEGGALNVVTGALRMVTFGGDIYLENDYGTSFTLSDDVCSAGGELIPRRDAYYGLGTSDFSWADIYLVNDPIVTSDRNKKFDITYGLEAFDGLFDLLKPGSFRRCDGDSFRLHMGLVAQDVEDARDAVGIPSSELAALVRSSGGEGQDYALRYGEFIALLIWQVQQLKARVAELERSIV